MLLARLILIVAKVTCVSNTVFFRRQEGGEGVKRKFWNWIKNDAGGEEERTLVLNGEISDETWYGDEVTPALFAKELNAGSGNITVWINSPGGDVYASRRPTLRTQAH